MKLTEQHVSDKNIDYVIKIMEHPISNLNDIILKGFLELKQRRAEYRQREFDNGSNNA